MGITAFGLDYGGTLSPAAHHSVGSTFACRYLRELWASEVNELIGGGVNVVLIHERLADAALGGHAYGVRDAKDALGSANALGAPTRVPIYFAVDFDETPGQAPVVADYFKGVASVVGLGRTGAYGGYWTVSRLFNAGLIKYGWQTYAWSGSNFDGRCQLFQYSNDHYVAGVNVDYDHAYAADYGQWSPSAPLPVTPATGIANFAGSFDLEHGAWTIKGTPGKCKFGSEGKWASAEIQINEKTGQWRVKGMPFNAAPLGS